MSSLGTQHPEEGLLLRYIDGELPSRKVRQVERHLEACWQCRTEVEELQATVADCVRYRKNVLAAHLPPPPNPWPDLYRGFDRIDAEQAESWISRLLAPARNRWALAAAAAAVLACGVFYQLRQTPSVEAAALLKEAVSAAEARPATARRYQVRTRTQKFIRIAGHRTSDPAAASLEARFEAAHYDPEDPLSAKSFQGWRGTLSSRVDAVTTVADCYQVRTTTPEGDLASASLMLRETDLEPVEARLEFRDQEWVELTEIADGSIRDGIPPAVTDLEPRVRRAEPSRPAATTSGESVSISEELQVLAALHGIGADLGDPVEVTRSGSKLLVSGVGIPVERQQQIHEVLNGMPRVEVEFTSPAAASVPAEPAGAAPASGGGAAPSIQMRMEQQLGGRADFERFSTQLLDRNEALMSRAYALRALAQRFPASAEGGFSAQDRQVLRDMALKHASVLGREAATITRALEPVLVSMGGSAAARPAAATASWQDCAEELFHASHRAELLLSEVLGASPVRTPADRLPSELLSAMRDLHAELDQCQKLLAGR